MSMAADLFWSCNNSSVNCRYHQIIPNLWKTDWSGCVLDRGRIGGFRSELDTEGARTQCRLLRRPLLDYLRNLRQRREGGIFARVSLIFIAVGCRRVVATLFYSEKIGSIHSGSHNIIAHQRLYANLLIRLSCLSSSQSRPRGIGG